MASVIDEQLPQVKWVGVMHEGVPCRRSDLDACIKLSNQIAKDAGAKITNEAEFPKYHSWMLDLESACGLRDFAGAEKIANDIKATYHLDR